MASPHQIIIPSRSRHSSVSSSPGIMSQSSPPIKGSLSSSPSSKGSQSSSPSSKVRLSSSPRKTSVASLRNHVAELIQCAICIEPPKDPRCLPCLHTYCLRCIEEFYARSFGNRLSTTETIQCPECCKQSEIPPGGLVNLPTDFRVKQLEDIFSGATDLQEEISTSPSISDLGNSPPSSNKLETTAARTQTLHDLIEQNPREARDFASSLSYRDQRRVVTKLVDGRSALCVASDVQAYDLMVHFIEHCRADVNQIIVGTARAGKEVESSILIQAAAANDLTAAQVLVGHGAKVNQADGEGITALFVACLEGSLDFTEYLLDVGAEVAHSVNKYGAAPIMAASSRGHLNILKCLVDHGADVNAPQVDGYTPLMAACHKSRNPDQTVAFLMTQWADPNCQDKKGWTAVMYAIQRGSADSLAILLMNGAHVNIKDEQGETALHHAIVKCRLDIIQLLMNHGADPHVKNKQGVTCLDLAVHNAAMAKILKTFKRIKRKK